MKTRPPEPPLVPLLVFAASLVFGLVFGLADWIAGGALTEMLRPN